MQFANMKSRRARRFLIWLENHKGVTVESGGKHPYKVSCIHNNQSYPLPISHGEINSHTMKHFCEWLVANEICEWSEIEKNL